MDNDSTRKRKAVDDCTPSERLTRSKAKAIIDGEFLSFLFEIQLNSFHSS